MWLRHAARSFIIDLTYGMLCYVPALDVDLYHDWRAAHERHERQRGRGF